MTYTYPWYLGLAAVACSVACVAIGQWQVRRKGWTMKTTSWFIGAVCAVLFGVPAVALTRLDITPDTVSYRGGVWLIDPVDIHLDLQAIETVTQTYWRGRRGSENTAWLVKYRNGQSQKIELGYLWEMHAGEIVTALKQRGATFVDMKQAGG